MTTQLNLAFNLQATWVIDVLALFFDMLSMGVCITGHYQTSNRPVQESNVCTVHIYECVGTLTQRDKTWNDICVRDNQIHFKKEVAGQS